MSARRYSQFKERKVSGDKETPATGRRSKKDQTLRDVSTKWPSPPGKINPQKRSLGYPIVKTFQAGDYMEGNRGMGRAGFPLRAVAQVPRVRIPPAITPIPSAVPEPLPLPVLKPRARRY